MSLQTRAAVLSIVAALALMLGVGALSAGSPALETPAGVTVSGHVFYDLNMNGVYDTDPNGKWEPGVDDAIVELRYGSTVVTPRTDARDPGAYFFDSVAAGSYTVAEVTGLDQKISTSPRVVPITVGSEPVTVIVNFGVAQKRTVSGRVYVDSSNDGYTPGVDTVLVNARVKIIQDTDGDGMMDYGEPMLGEDVDGSDIYGFYTVDNIPPGDCIMTVVPAEAGGYAGAPVPMFLSAIPPFGEASAANVPYEPGTLVALTGKVWNDVDGDEEIDGAGEPGLSGVGVEVYGAVSGAEPSVVGSAITGVDGKYTVPGLFAGYPYEVRPVPATVPPGWLMGTDPGDLAVTLSGAPGQNVVNVGYFNPLAPSPLRQSDWKKELKQAGKPRYTEAQVDDFIGKAEVASKVFAEVVGIEAVLTKSPISGELGHALKEHAALWLNLASTRLYAKTPISLPELTTAQTVGAAVSEIEGILAPGRTPPPTKEDLQRAWRLAEALNSGKGLGAGRPGVFSVALATYRGASVASKLRPGGDLVDLATDAPAYLLKWSSGDLDPAINVVQPKLRVKVKVFMDGGVLDVVQVLPDGRTQLLGTVVPPVWNKDVNATYLFDLRGVSTAVELISSEIRFITRDVNSGGKVGRSKIDSAELVFTY